MKYLLLSGLVLLSVIAQAQITVTNVDKRIVYQLQYQFDSTDSKAVASERFFLDIGNNATIFRSESMYLKDSVSKTNNPMGLMSIPKTRFIYTIIKDHNKGNQTLLYDYTAFKFELNNNSENLDWEITNESKNILGYKCTLAKTRFAGRDYEAWFTSDIPIQDGPYKFSGLPGLIIDLYDTKNHYHFAAVGIMNLSAKDISLDMDGFKKITKAELSEFERKVKEKPSLILYNPGIQLPQEGLDKYDRNHREANKKRNNPIELTGV